MTQMFISLMFAAAMGVLSLAAAYTEPTAAPTTSAAIVAPEGY